jgi:myo-inositol 2-dehydrogenase/D-chiro-inositol 1-dehydrogenase
MGIGIGVIGAGVMGADHARIVAGQVQGARLAAVSDAEEERARAVAAPRGARAYRDGNALIDDAEVDAVLVASPDATHPDYVLACMAAGKPVLCEKPLAPTSDECLRVVEAEAVGGRRMVQVGFMRRFDPAYAEMRAGLREGGLGRALLLHCAHRNASAPDWFTSEMSITNSAVHEFDVIRWITGEEIVAITALKSVAKPGRMPRDPIMVLVETSSGILADIELFLNAAYGYDVRAELVCENGTIELARPRPAEIRQAGKQSVAFPPDWRGRFADAYRLELQAWVDSLSGGAAPGASAWDGYVATKIAEAGLHSLGSDHRTEVKLGTMPELYRPMRA